MLNLLEDLLDADEHFWEVGSEHVKVGAAASNRLMIIRLRTAALGNAFETDEDDIENGGGTSIALPAAQIIPHGVAALTKAKVVSARTKLDQSPCLTMARNFVSDIRRDTVARLRPASRPA